MNRYGQVWGGMAVVGKRTLGPEVEKFEQVPSGHIESAPCEQSHTTENTTFRNYACRR